MSKTVRRATSARRIMGGGVNAAQMSVPPVVHGRHVLNVREASN